MQHPFIYHEKQVARLCGVHCLNALLQGSYFTEVDLANIALELDQQEKKLMMEMGTETTDFLKYMAEDSGNVADSGDYSVQVLEKALAMWDLTVIPINAAIAKDAIQENAFICNLSDHWFTIRKIGNKWYNLNSLNKAPEELSPFYLSLYIETLLGSGWSVFVIRGNLPPVTSNTICSEGGRWVPIAECSIQKSSQAQNNRSSPDHNDELEAAIALSLSGVNTKTSPAPKPQQSDNQYDEEEALQSALEASELEAAIAASLQRYP